MIPIYSLSQQWPKRTRTSSAISPMTHQSSTSNVSQPTNGTNVAHHVNASFSTTNTSNVTTDEISEQNKVILESSDISLVKFNSSKSNQSLEMSAIRSSKASSENVENVESSTKSQLVQKLMSTLGLSYCPPIPPDLGRRVTCYINPVPYVSIRFFVFSRQHQRKYYARRYESNRISFCWKITTRWLV